MQKAALLLAAACVLTGCSTYDAVIKAGFEIPQYTPVVVAPVVFEALPENCSDFAGTTRPTELVSQEIMKLGFGVVDRSILEEILSEHDLQMTGHINKDTRTKIGNLSGAKAIVVGTINVEDTGIIGSIFKTAGNFKMVCIETGEVLWHCRYKRDYFDLNTAMEKCIIGAFATLRKKGLGKR